MWLTVNKKKKNRSLRMNHKVTNEKTGTFVKINSILTKLKTFSSELFDEISGQVKLILSIAIDDKL
jgi:hypothetical protein